MSEPRFAGATLYVPTPKTAARIEEKPCEREGCAFVEHPKQGHGFCCNKCKANGQHGPACLKLLHGKPAEGQDAKGMEREEPKPDVVATPPLDSGLLEGEVDETAAADVDSDSGLLVDTRSLLDLLKGEVDQKAAAEVDTRVAAKEDDVWKAAEAFRAAEAVAKAAKTDAKAEAGIALQLGPFAAVLSRLSGSAFVIRVASLGKGNLRFLADAEGAVSVDFNGGRGKWATFRAEAAPFDQVYLINDATGSYLGLDGTERLTACDGYKFPLKDAEGAPVSIASDSDWEEARTAAPHARTTYTQ